MEFCFSPFWGHFPSFTADWALNASIKHKCWWNYIWCRKVFKGKNVKSHRPNIYKWAGCSVIGLVWSALINNFSWNQWRSLPCSYMFTFISGFGKLEGRNSDPTQTAVKQLNIQALTNRAVSSHPYLNTTLTPAVPAIGPGSWLSIMKVPTSYGHYILWTNWDCHESFTLSKTLQGIQDSKNSYSCGATYSNETALQILWGGQQRNRSVFNSSPSSLFLRGGLADFRDSPD